MVSCTCTVRVDDQFVYITRNCPLHQDLTGPDLLDWLADLLDFATRFGEILTEDAPAWPGR